VRIHERGSGLRMIGEGIYLWENGLRVLDALGVLAPVIADGIRVVRHEKRNHQGKKLSSSSFGNDFRLYGQRRENLLVTLFDAFVETGGEMVFNSRAIGADPDGICILQTEAQYVPISWSAPTGSIPRSATVWSC
jgi:2-polyprenyl-6-methoxyphenol hydroxylase-like FAD-dependent oxidoreductase